MSLLAQLMEKGLDVEMEAAISSYATKSDEASLKAIDELRTLVDTKGLKGPDTMKKIGELQRSGILKPGIYKDFSALHDKLGTNGAATVATPTMAATTPATVDAKKREKAPELPDDVVKNFAFSESQEERIREKLRKEEERVRERMLEKERRIRERMITGSTKRAERLGLKAEDAQKIQVLLDNIKKHRESMKTMRAEMQQWRTEIYTIRPKRPRKPRDPDAPKKERKPRAKKANATAPVTAPATA